MKNFVFRSFILFTALVIVTDANAAMLSGNIDSSYILQDKKIWIKIYSKENTNRSEKQSASVKIIPVEQNRCVWSYSVKDIQPGRYSVELIAGSSTRLEGDTLAKRKIIVKNNISELNILPKRIIKVGKGHKYKKPSDAARIAKKGDVIEIDAGIYKGDATVWYVSNITIRGVGGRAIIKADGAEVEGKGVWVIKGKDVRIENIEISGASVSDKNGAAVRLEGRNINMCNVYFHHNENGILGGGGHVLIEYSEFARNGFGEGQTHNLYIDNTDKFTLRYSYSHHAKVGHNVKSRAKKNYILYNRIMDEYDGRASYAVDIPDGGEAYLVGNILQQSKNTENYTIVSYGAEVDRVDNGTLYLINNTLVNNRHNAVFVSVQKGTNAYLINNLFVGNGTPVRGEVRLENNLQTGNKGFVNPDAFDYRIKSDSTAINEGKFPTKNIQLRWFPRYQYIHKMKRQRRIIYGEPDIGAYEFKP